MTRLLSALLAVYFVVSWKTWEATGGPGPRVDEFGRVATSVKAVCYFKSFDHERVFTDEKEANDFYERAKKQSVPLAFASGTISDVQIKRIEETEVSK